MKLLTSRKCLFYFVTMLAISSPAYAYLDPGTGSMILQGIIAAIAVASMTVKMYWYRLKSFFAGKTGQQSSTSSGKDAVRQEGKENLKP